ncbi:MAG: UbiX family flavin prenyltransferase [Sulfolobales archaeon]|nr:UbiX family flavin prenyltransferase [Sulfolobales archaeon]MCX8209013.1 UbiX family flavin prenyltransferase [Sulfolobales archaeon]MDW8010015.1 UbiX family flavin prenyltransferase [Sulfolobales archaeon]
MYVVVGVTGSSGLVLALRLTEVLNSMNCRVDVVLSKASARVAEGECVSPEFFVSKIRELGAREVYWEDDLSAPLSSSSYFVYVDWVAVIPATIKTVSSIAHGLADNLIVRAATNALRLGKKVIAVIRESPLGYVELRSLYMAAKAGVTVVPAVVGFYAKPTTLRDVVDFIVGKVLDVAGITTHSLYTRWPQSSSIGGDLCSALYGEGGGAPGRASQHS